MIPLVHSIFRSKSVHGVYPETVKHQDPWGNEYIYVRSEKQFRFYSRGPNGKDDDGKGDDVALR